MWSRLPSFLHSRQGTWLQQPTPYGLTTTVLVVDSGVSWRLESIVFSFPGGIRCLLMFLPGFDVFLKKCFELNPVRDVGGVRDRPPAFQEHSSLATVPGQATAGGGGHPIPQGKEDEKQEIAGKADRCL